MPNISLVELAKIVAKLALVALLSSLILGFVGSFVSVIISIMSTMSSSLSTLNGVNLGWFANAIGLVSMLNALLQSLYIAGSVLISGVVAIFTFKFGMKFYDNLMKV
jgi:hypothetical protein